MAVDNTDNNSSVLDVDEVLDMDNMGIDTHKDTVVDNMDTADTMGMADTAAYDMIAVFLPPVPYRSIPLVQ